tara:strand:+ start:1029 stop:1325 length:297 start_codon:yes stop_codon:yes gene_type:complete
MIEEIGPYLMLIIPLLYVKLTKSDDTNYFLIIALAVLGGAWSLNSSGDPVGGALFPFLPMIISLVALLNKNWTIGKTLEKSLKVMIVLVIIVWLGELL